MGYKFVEHANYIDRKFYGWSATEIQKYSRFRNAAPREHTDFG